MKRMTIKKASEITMYSGEQLRVWKNGFNHCLSLMKHSKRKPSDKTRQDVTDKMM